MNKSVSACSVTLTEGHGAGRAEPVLAVSPPEMPMGLLSQIAAQALDPKVRFLATVSYL